MKKQNKAILFIWVLTLFLSACTEDSDETKVDSESPWDEQFIFGNTIINGYSVVTNEVSTESSAIIDEVCNDRLPSENLTSFSVHIYIPKHMGEGYQSGFEEDGIYVDYGGMRSPNIYLSGSIKFIRTTEFNGLTYSEFLIGGVYTGSTPITKYNFENLVIYFKMKYLDPYGEEIYSSPKSITIMNTNC